MIKIAIGLVLLAHGIGHSMGILQVLNVATVNPAWRGDSWVLTSAIGTTVSQVVGVVIWVTAIAGFAALAAVVVGWLPASWWQPLAVGSSAISLVGVLLFPIAFPTFSTIGAVLVDVAVLAAVFAFHWGPADLPA
jgi:hypothetical protein